MTPDETRQDGIVPTAGKWLTFDDPRYDLTFDYPLMTSSGEAVQVEDEEHHDRRRVRLHTEDGREVYFELRQAQHATPDEEIAGLRRSVLGHTPDARFGELETALLAALPAVRLTFEFGRRVRTAVLARAGATLYGLIYDPRSASNERIVASLRRRT